jgi:hypothetical protein
VGNLQAGFDEGLSPLQFHAAGAPATVEENRKHLVSKIGRLVGSGRPLFTISPVAFSAARTLFPVGPPWRRERGR